MATKTQTPKSLRKELQKTADDAVATAKTTVESVQRDLTEAAGDVQDAVQVLAARAAFRPIARERALLP